jgi:hypothetical protein
VRYSELGPANNNKKKGPGPSVRLEGQVQTVSALKKKKVQTVSWYSTEYSSKQFIWFRVPSSPVRCRSAETSHLLLILVADETKPCSICAGSAPPHPKNSRRSPWQRCRCKDRPVQEQGIPRCYHAGVRDCGKPGKVPASPLRPRPRKLPCPLPCRSACLASSRI